MRAGWPYIDQQPKLPNGPCSSSRLMVVVSRGIPIPLPRSWKTDSASSFQQTMRTGQPASGRRKPDGQEMADAGHDAVLVGPEAGLVDPGEGINPVLALGVVDPVPAGDAVNAPSGQSCSGTSRHARGGQSAPRSWRVLPAFCAARPRELWSSA